MFYEFSAEWCGPCKMLEREVFMDQDLAKRINDRFIAVKVVDTKQEEGRNWPDVQAADGSLRRQRLSDHRHRWTRTAASSTASSVIPAPARMAAFIDRAR